MLELELKSFSQLQHLFMLFKLPETDQELELEYNHLMKIAGEKDRAVQHCKYELAARKRQKEIESINNIIDLLNTRWVFQKNVLRIKIKKYKPAETPFD